MPSRQKLGAILGNKSYQKLKKKEKRKMYSLKNNLNLFIFLNGNQSLKDSDESFHKKLSLKVQF